MLAALTIFSASCKTAGHKGSLEFQAAIEEWEGAMQALEIPMPISPEMEAVAFEDRDGGLWLSYNDYRALERNITAMREYSEKLKTVIWFYRGLE